MTRGLDTAEVDGNSPPDYHAAYAAGARFTYLKASQHVYPDHYYGRDSGPARAAGLVVGAYHFPGWGPRAASANAQIGSFVTVLANSGDPQRGVDLPPVLDIEGFKGCGWSPAECVEFVRQLVLEVQDQMHVTPGLYTSYFQWDDLGRPSLAQVPWMADTALFLKTAYRHPARAPYDPSPARAPHAGVTADDPHDYYRAPPVWDRAGVWFQQHDGDAVGFPGFSKTVDVDRFFGLDAPQGDTLVSDPRVTWLQGKLGVPQNGTYGPVTEAAVRALQGRSNLPQTGAVDVATFAVVAWL